MRPSRRVLTRRSSRNRASCCETAACGSASEYACFSEAAGTTLGGAFSVQEGDTYWIYLDPESGRPAMCTFVIGGARQAPTVATWWSSPKAVASCTSARSMSSGPTPAIS